MSKKDFEFEYMLLNRLHCDCKYYLQTGGTRKSNQLWAGNPEDQIKKMQELYNIVPVKPDWLTQKDIDFYAYRMITKSK